VQKTFIRYLSLSSLLLDALSIRGATGATACSFLPLILLPGILLSAAVASLGQGGGAIVGRILDPTGAAISGAKVTLRNQQSGAGRAAPLTSTTNDEGRFRFERLSPGSYQLNVSAENFNPLALTIAPVESDREIEINLVPRGLDEFVTKPARESKDSTNA
jgi:hypothetical protein